MDPNTSVQTTKSSAARTANELAARKNIVRSAAKTIKKDDAEIVSTTVKPTRRVVGLLGFLSKAEVHSIFQQLPFQAVDSTDPLELWRKSSEERKNLTALAPAIQPLDLPADTKSAVDAIRHRQTFRRHYESVADYHFGLVPVVSLLTPQWYADLDYVEELAASLKKNMSVTSLLNFVMPEGLITVPIVRGNQVLFTSHRLDLNAVPIPEVRELGDGELEIVVRASSRPNYVQAAMIDERLFLTNGVHKVLALYRAGYGEIPCIWRKAHDLGDAGVNSQSTSLFHDATFKSNRPAMVLDFLNEKVVAPLRMRSMYQVMRLSIGVEQFQVPALDDFA